MFIAPFLNYTYFGPNCSFLSEIESTPSHMKGKMVLFLEAGAGKEGSAYATPATAGTVVPVGPLVSSSSASSPEILAISEGN